MRLHEQKTIEAPTPEEVMRYTTPDQVITVMEAPEMLAPTMWQQVWNLIGTSTTSDHPPQTTRFIVPEGAPATGLFTDENNKHQFWYEVISHTVSDDNLNPDDNIWKLTCQVLLHPYRPSGVPHPNAHKVPTNVEVKVHMEGGVVVEKTVETHRFKNPPHWSPSYANERAGFCIQHFAFRYLPEAMGKRGVSFRPLRVMQGPRADERAQGHQQYDLYVR